MPPAPVRLAGEAAFLVLVAVGLVLAELDPIVIVAVMLAALVVVALLERVSSKEAARVADVAEEEPQAAATPPAAEPADVEPATQAQELGPAPEAEHEATVDERSARALLASGHPPLPPEAPKPGRVRRLVERRPERRRTPPAAPPEPAPREAEAPAREWNLWELERAVRHSSEETRREEWNALLIHLREFANADGDLPVEFDRFVRESFAAALGGGDREPAAAP